MNTQEGYNQWSGTYDEVANKTRDLEAKAIRNILDGEELIDVLEIGCGTGKNTEWLVTKAEFVTAVDFSEAMLNKAKEKLQFPNLKFIHADITQEWNFVNTLFDAITCSLILEHIEDLNFIFNQAKTALKQGGLFYVGELHPFKQYQGSKARFETKEATQVLECFTHHFSDYFQAAFFNGFECIALNEWFDDEDTLQQLTPRIVSFLFKKK